MGTEKGGRKGERGRREKGEVEEGGAAWANYAPPSEKAHAATAYKP